jgi:hypothetical protein
MARFALSRAAATKVRQAVLAESNGHSASDNALRCPDCRAWSADPPVTA